MPERTLIAYNRACQRADRRVFLSGFLLKTLRRSFKVSDHERTYKQFQDADIEERAYMKAGPLSGLSLIHI